jgi:Micrococcal nuclease (thermonuclease) homologs
MRMIDPFSPSRPLLLTVATTFLALLLAMAQAIAGPSSPAGPLAHDISGRASVVDGDTLEIHGQRIRLWGVDAPESSQVCEHAGRRWRCGAQVANALADWIGQRTVSCVTLNRDRYGRAVARCQVGGEDIAGWLVERGYAWAYVRYSRHYVAAEARARLRKAGVHGWNVEVPWEYRARRRAG